MICLIIRYPTNITNTTAASTVSIQTSEYTATESTIRNCRFSQEEIEHMFTTSDIVQVIILFLSLRNQNLN